MTNEELPDGLRLNEIITRLTEFEDGSALERSDITKCSAHEAKWIAQRLKTAEAEVQRLGGCLSDANAELMEVDELRAKIATVKDALDGLVLAGFGPGPTGDETEWILQMPMKASERHYSIARKKAEIEAALGNLEQ